MNAIPVNKILDIQDRYFVLMYDYDKICGIIKKNESSKVFFATRYISPAWLSNYAFSSLRYVKISTQMNEQLNKILKYYN